MRLRWATKTTLCGILYTLPYVSGCFSDPKDQEILELQRAFVALREQNEDLSAKLQEMTNSLSAKDGELQKISSATKELESRLPGMDQIDLPDGDRSREVVAIGLACRYIDLHERLSKRLDSAYNINVSLELQRMTAGSEAPAGSIYEAVYGQPAKK